MELRQLKYFCKLIEETSFRKAAFELNISQSALSQQISSLELELNVLLFRREGRNTYPTQAGFLFYRKAKTILDLSDTTKKEVANFNNTIAGILSISTNTTSPILSKTIREFSVKYPDVLFDILEGNHKMVMECLLSGKSDIAITDYDEEDNYTYNHMQMDLQNFKVVGLERFIPDNIDILDGIKLKDVPLIIYKTDLDIIRNYCLRYKFEPAIIAYVDSTESKIRLANMGIGVALGSESCAESAEKYGMNSAYLADFNHQIRRCIFWKDEYSLSLVASEFLQALINESKIM